KFPGPTRPAIVDDAPPTALLHQRQNSARRPERTHVFDVEIVEPPPHQDGDRHDGNALSKTARGHTRAARAITPPRAARSPVHHHARAPLYVSLRREWHPRALARVPVRKSRPSLLTHPAAAAPRKPQRLLDLEEPHHLGLFHAICAKNFAQGSARTAHWRLIVPLQQQVLVEREDCIKPGEKIDDTATDLWWMGGLEVRDRIKPAIHVAEHVAYCRLELVKRLLGGGVAAELVFSLHFGKRCFEAAARLVKPQQVSEASIMSNFRRT